MLLLAFIAAVVAQVKLPPGSALSMSQSAGATVTPCPLQVDISAARAGPTCQLQIFASLTAGTVGATFAFYWSKVSTFNSTDAVPLAGGQTTQAVVDCKTAGTYYLGVTVTSCPLCKLGLKAYYDLGVYYQIGSDVHVDLDPAQPTLTTWMNLPGSTYIYFDLTIAHAGAPHFTLEKSVDSAVDNYDYYFGPSNIDYSNSSLASPYVTDVGAVDKEFMANETQPGSYSFVVHTRGKSSFRLTFNWDTDTKQSYPSNSVCPTTTCSSIYNCQDCAKSNCFWCQSLYTCQDGPTCGSTATVDPKPFTAATSANMTAMTPAPTMANSGINDATQCVDQDTACKAIKHCTDCVKTKGCVWCDTLATVGINSGSCSAGKDNNGMKCSNLLIDPYTAAKCPASHSVLALAVLLLASIAALI